MYKFRYKLFRNKSLQQEKVLWSSGMTSRCGRASPGSIPGSASSYLFFAPLHFFFFSPASLGLVFTLLQAHMGINAQLNASFAACFLLNHGPRSDRATILQRRSHNVGQTTKTNNNTTYSANLYQPNQCTVVPVRSAHNWHTKL